MHPVIWMLIAFAVLAAFVGFIRVSEIGAEARRREKQAKARAAAAKAPPPAPDPTLMRSYPGDLERPHRHAAPVRTHAQQPGMSTTDAVLIGMVIGGAFDSGSHHHHHDGGGYDCGDDGSSWC